MLFLTSQKTFIFRLGQRIFLTLFFYPCILSSPYIISKFDSHEHVLLENLSDIRVSTGELNIFTVIKISSYIEAKTDMLRLFVAAKSLCEVFNQTNNENSCSDTIFEFSNKIKVFESRETLIEEYQMVKREKRNILAAVGIGSLAVGVALTSNFLHASNSELDSKIATLKNPDKMLELNGNNTTLLEISIRPLQDNNVLKELKLSEVELYDLINYVKLNEFNVIFDRLCINFLLFFDDLSSRQKTLIDLIHSKTNQMDPTVISFEDFKDAVSSLKDGSTYMTEHDLMDLYVHSYVTARMTQSNIVFMIKIPLLSIEKYQMLKIVPIPFEKEGKFYEIKLNYDLILVNSQKSEYFLNNNLENCYFINRLLVCNYLSPRNSPVCEFMLVNGMMSEDCKLVEFLNNRNKFTQLMTPNRWIFYIVKQSRIQINCSSVINHFIWEPQAGLIEFKDDCELFDEDWTLHSFKILNSSVGNYFIPKFNTTWVDELPPINVTIREPKLLKDLIILANKMKEQKGEKLEEGVSNGITKHSIQWFIIILIITLIIIILFYKKRAKRKEISFCRFNNVSMRYTRNEIVND